MFNLLVTFSLQFLHLKCWLQTAGRLTSRWRIVTEVEEEEQPSSFPWLSRERVHILQEASEFWGRKQQLSKRQKSLCQVHRSHHLKYSKYILSSEVKTRQLTSKQKHHKPQFQSLFYFFCQAFICPSLEPTEPQWLLLRAIQKHRIQHESNPMASVWNIRYYRNICVKTLLTRIEQVTRKMTTALTGSFIWSPKTW